MTTKKDHLFEQYEVVKCLESAWNITTPPLPIKKIEECKLKDFELLEKAIINYFKNTEFSKIDVPGAGAIYNLLLKGESKRNRAMAVIAFYILHKNNSLTEKELKQIKNIPSESLFSNYNNRIEILNIYKNVTKENSFKFKESIYSKIRETKPIQVAFVVLSIVIITCIFPFVFFFDEPDWDIEISPLIDESLIKLSVLYQLKPFQHKNAFLKFSDGTIKKLEISQGKASIITSNKDIQKVDLVIFDNVFTKFYIHETKDWVALLNDKLIPDSSYKLNGQLSLKSSEELKKIQLKKTKNFNASLDNLKFEIKIRKKEQILNCKNSINLELNGISKTDITSLKIKLVDPNCEENAELIIGESNLNYSNEDLSFLEVDTHDWIEIMGDIKNHHLHLYINNKLVKKVPYTSELGLLKSIHISSNQNFMVDYFRLYNQHLGYFVNDSF